MSPSLYKALQNQNVKTASYTLPDGTILDPREQVNMICSYFIIKYTFYCCIPFLCLLLLFFNNLKLINDFSSVSPRLIKQTVSPNLAKALNNPALREASYSLPDGTIVIDPRKPKSPTLNAALQNPYLKSASYTLPDGTIIIDPRKPASPNLGSVLQSSALRDASLRLPQGINDPNSPISPNLMQVYFQLQVFHLHSLYM